MENVTIISDEELNKLVNEFIENWAKNNPTLDKSFYWSGVNDGVYLLKKELLKQLK